MTKAGRWCSWAPPTGLLSRRWSLHPTADPGGRTVRCRSGADLEAGEALDGHAGLVEDLLDRLLAVGDGRLVEEGDLLEEAVEPALDDLGERALGLALLTSGGLGDLALLGHDVLGDLVAGDVDRTHRGDLHRGTAR